jgi:hypothetical protein
VGRAALTDAHDERREYSRMGNKITRDVRIEDAAF